MMIQGWRWFGPQDPVTLSFARQAGAQSIVTALHDKYDGRVWTSEDLGARKAMLRKAGFDWSVCESIPMPGEIKLRSKSWRVSVDRWKDSLANLGRAGVPVVCYNFMPVVDWTRTELCRKTQSGGEALSFNMTAFAAYDVFILRRPGAEGDYTSAVLARAEELAGQLDDSAISRLEHTIIAGLPGGEDSHTRTGIRSRIAEYSNMTDADYRSNLMSFLRDVVPVAEDVGVRLAIHPDDPPFRLFGLPRVVSTAEDIRQILAAVESTANGLTLCTGSLASRLDNDVVAIAREFASRIQFAHLRNVTCEPDGSFTESDHLGGRVDIVTIIAILLREERRRLQAGEVQSEITMRPDHGHILLDDAGKRVNPGYSCIGRLKGLAELRGVMTAVDRFVDLANPPRVGELT